MTSYKRQYRVLLTNRLSSRWAGRVNAIYSMTKDYQIDWSKDPDYIPVDDLCIVCDLCNASFPEDPETVIPILQHRWTESEEWYDVGTRCPECLEDQKRTMSKMGHPLKEVLEQ